MEVYYKQDRENGDFYSLFRALKKKEGVTNKELVKKLGKKNENTLTATVKTQYLKLSTMEAIVKAINENLELVVIDNYDETAKLHVIDWRE